MKKMARTRKTILIDEKIAKGKVERAKARYIHETKNTGSKFEKYVYDLIIQLLTQGDFLVAPKNAQAYLGKKYYSKERDDYIKTDISVEKFFNSTLGTKPDLLIIIECKDYKGKIPIDDIEEFHAKLQQIGADNTKGIIISNKLCGFQKSAVNYAKSQGITLVSLEEDIFKPIEDAMNPLILFRWLFYFIDILLAIPRKIIDLIKYPMRMRKEFLKFSNVNVYVYESVECNLEVDCYIGKSLPLHVFLKEELEK